MAKFRFWLIIALNCAALCHVAFANGTDETPSALLPLEARNADDGTSAEEDVISTSYVLPNQIFNDGKPYYAGKDSVSGQIDFSAKKPAGIEPEANEVLDPKEKIVLTSSSPNIHDFLNLPVKYSSSKFVYPLVSSSYANLKYQGSNKNYITNKKPTSIVATITPPPNYHSSNYYTVPTTKLMAVPPTASGLYPSLPSSTTTTTTTTTTVTSKKPTQTTTSISTPSTTKTTPSITTTTTSTAVPTYTTSRRPIPVSTTTSIPHTSTTRKKFVPTKKYIPTTTTTTSSTATPPMRFPDAVNTTTTPAKPKPTTTAVFTTRHPTPPSNIFPSDAPTTTFSSSVKPVVLTEDPSATPAFSPLPTSTRVPNLDPADVYHTLEQKYNVQQQQQGPVQTPSKPPMTLADIFNSLAEEESAVASNNYQQNQGFDAQGNLIEPIAPSQPSPFVTQNQGQKSGAQHQQSASGLSPPPPQQQQQQQQQQQKPHFTNEQKVISGSQENFGNEYVSYQVQQPNMMQYRPAPGAINNVVISPGQHSASFVLGSQQQVGANAFGTIEKEPLFSKEKPVQYGTVINEDINNIKRPSQLPDNYPPQQNVPVQSNYQQMPGSLPSNFHQNGNIGIGSTAPESQTSQQLPYGGFKELPPEAPSPYQQLPLIGTTKRPSKPTQQQEQQTTLAQQPSNTNYKLSPPLGSSQATYPSKAQPQSQIQNQVNQQQLQQQHHQQQLSQTGSSDLQGQDTKELLVSTNIRFPANEEESVEVPSMPVAPGPPSGPQVNGHAQPLSLQQIQNANPVVFPKQKDEDLYQHSDGISDVQVQQHEVLTMNQHKQKLNFPQQSEQQAPAPSQNMEPPPRFPPTFPPNAQGPPHPVRQHGPPSQYAYKEYTRKPIPGITRPNSDRNLPNILPQFRPNAKLSSGHPPNYNQEPGNIRIHGQMPMKRPNQSPQFAHRRQPLMQQKRYPMNRISEYPVGALPPPGADANRRVYRLPPYGGQGIQYLDRMYPRPRPVPQQNYPVERHAQIAPGDMEPYKTILPEKMSDFEEEDLVINDPPQPVTPSKERPQIIDEAKLEPVVTLQMLQSHKKAVSLPNDDTGAGEIQVPSEGDNDLEDNEQAIDQISQDGLYVVYPMKGGQKDIDNSGKDALPAIAHIEAPSGSDYQNTPFSVIRDQPQEPILTVKNKKPQSLQQQTRTQSSKEKFPYPIEKPDPSYSELHPGVRVPGVLIAPRIINGAYGSGTEAPIAIAYTPTEPNVYRRTGPQGTDSNKYSNVNLATAVIDEIRSDTQTEEGISNDFDLRGQNFEKDFMAPFYPSVSLGNAANTPANSWNILPSTTNPSVYEKNNINRADVVAEDKHIESEDPEAEATTKSFELDSFQPELQGGFQPIYPPGYKHDDHEEDEGEPMQPQENNIPLALASRMEPPAPLVSTTTTAIPITSTTPKPPPEISSSSTTTTTTTPKPQSSTMRSLTNEESPSPTTPAPPPPSPTPTQRKKSTFETSLAALLFGDDEEFQDEARKANLQAKSGPRTIPRMGPRSLKLS